MSIEVKRSCNSSVRLTEDRINFNCITISLTGEVAQLYHKITALYKDMKDTELLAHLIALGIVRSAQYMDMIDGGDDE